ncbi:MAG TPA: hypothetical protein PK095_03720 [Myxococcota bacterium]|nr:hypothetical protein [Myxococcota bacterium]
MNSRTIMGVVLGLSLSWSGCLADQGTRLDTSDIETSDSRAPDSATDNDTDVDASLPPALGQITSDQGEEALPGTVVQLGVEFDPDLEETVTGYRWSVDQPPGSRSLFAPNEHMRAPTFEAWVVGSYVFHLDVILNDGYRRIGSYQMRVLPTDAVHVELTWRTPGDPDETDSGGTASFSAGSDVDLHVLHPNAQAKFFDWTWDCYWENMRPEWGVFGLTDNPKLDRDDTDGTGPEVISIETTEPVAYRVGVHYWNDWGYGEVFATVRLYLGGVLQDEWEVEMRNGDMWESHTIDGATGTVTRLTTEDDESAVITSPYPVPPLGERQ